MRALARASVAAATCWPCAPANAARYSPARPSVRPSVRPAGRSAHKQRPADQMDHQIASPRVGPFGQRRRQPSARLAAAERSRRRWHRIELSRRTSSFEKFRPTSEQLWNGQQQEEQRREQSQVSKRFKPLSAGPDLQQVASRRSCTETRHP